MDFGKLSDISGVDFSLPEEPLQTRNFLAWRKNGIGRLRIGCPSWTSRDWVGKIYASSLSASEYLSAYSRHFSTIELNATYYHLPSQKQILSWIEKVGDDFHFCPKISQTISHRRRLKEVGALVRQFCEMVLTFGSKLGVSFLQLPPEFTTAYRERLVSFVKELPRELCWAIEFRHPSWLEAFESVGDFLEERGVGTVITDVAGRRDVLHRHLTAPFVLIRFVGNSLHPTDYERLNQWAEVLKNWLQKEITVYFFIHQPSEKLCPETAVYFAQQVRRHLPSLSLVSPQIMNNIQGSLF